MSATIADSEATARDVDEFGHTHEQRVQANIEIWLMDYKYYGKRVSLSELRLEAESFFAALHAANLTIVPTPPPGMVMISVEDLEEAMMAMSFMRTTARNTWMHREYEQPYQRIVAILAAAEPENA
jgi:hypothetical protein